MDLISLSELCTELSISTATGRNWVKLGKILPTVETRKLFFSVVGMLLKLCTPFFTLLIWKYQ